MSLLEIEDLSLTIGRNADPPERRPDDRGRRSDGAGRRIRLRQVDDGAFRHAAAAGGVPRVGPDRLQRHRNPRRLGAADVRAARRRHRHGLPGADDGAQPVEDDRRAGRRGHSLAHRREPCRRRGAGAQNARPGRTAGRKIPALPLSARAIGRPAPARRHRHRLRAQSPSCSSPTNRRRRSTSCCRRRSWNCCAISSTRTAWDCCSSRTISPWSPRCPTASRSCATARSWNQARRRRRCRRNFIPTQGNWRRRPCTCRPASLSPPPCGEVAPRARVGVTSEPPHHPGQQTGRPSPQAGGHAPHRPKHHEGLSGPANLAVPKAASRSAQSTTSPSRLAKAIR